MGLNALFNTARLSALWGRGGRPLTEAEIDLAARIYGDALDYRSVHVFAHPYLWLQARNSAMAPFGGIYCADVYQTDFAAGPRHLQALFIHELAHVYQYQLKILHPVVAAAREHLRYPFEYFRCYAYELRPDWDLLDYGLEQQAVIIEDYARLTVLGLGRTACHYGSEPANMNALPALRQTLARFLEDPHYARQRRWRVRHLLGFNYSNIAPTDSRT